MPHRYSSIGDLAAIDREDLARITGPLSVAVCGDSVLLDLHAVLGISGEEHVPADPLGNAHPVTQEKVRQFVGGVGSLATGAD